jgi:hypothetical protein
VFDHWNEWFDVHKFRSHNDHDVPILSTNRWKKPRIGWLKCNVDATFFAGLGRTMMGPGFRNSSGEFTAGLTQWQQLALSTDEREAWAYIASSE